MEQKTFRVQIFAYQMHADFNITCLDGPLDIENSIIDKLGQNDIKWADLGEMHDPRVNRITYEEVIEDDNAKTSRGSIPQEGRSGSTMEAGTS